MKILVPVFVIFVAAAAVTAQSGRTVWDGVYTAEQATRGDKLYAERCAHCHGPSLSGGEGPALVGPLFAGTWEGVMLNELHDRIRQTMPLDNPGVLSRQDTSDIIAYMLKSGTMPAGTTALGTDAAALMQIKFVSNRP